MGIYVVRAFVQLCQVSAVHADLAKRLTELELTTERLELPHDAFRRNTRNQLRQVLEALRELADKVTPPEPPDPPKRPIGFVTHEDKKDSPKGITKAVKVARQESNVAYPAAKKRSHRNPTALATGRGCGWLF